MKHKNTWRDDLYKSIDDIKESLDCFTSGGTKDDLYALEYSIEMALARVQDALREIDK